MSKILSIQGLSDLQEQEGRQADGVAEVAANFASQCQVVGILDPDVRKSGNQRSKVKERTRVRGI